MISTILGSIPDWIQFLSLLCFFSSVIAACTPTPTESKGWVRVYRVIDFFACNWGKAKQ